MFHIILSNYVRSILFCSWFHVCTKSHCCKKKTFAKERHFPDNLILMFHLFDGSWSNDDVVESVTRYPDHRWQAETDTHDFRPCWILVTIPVFQGLVLHALEHEDELEKKKRWRIECGGWNFRIRVYACISTWKSIGRSSFVFYRPRSYSYIDKWQETKLLISTI